MADFHYPIAVLPNLIRSCRIVAGRNDLATALPKGKLIVQLGAGFGEVSQLLFDRCNPHKLVVLDPFSLHTTARWREGFGGRANAMDHQEYFHEKFAEQITRRRMELSSEIFASLDQLPERGVGISWLLDEIDYGTVRGYLSALQAKMANDGVVIVSNYIMNDYLRGDVYGVIQATNEFMVNNRWEMILFSLEPSMFCDVVIRKCG